MNRVLKKIGVVGDDVTGSNDIGIMFGKSDLKVHIFSHRFIRDSFEPADVIIIDTDSRFDKPEVAYRKVYDATVFLKEQGINQFYNKTCSVFRGNIGAEFDAMLDALNEEFAVVVLGFPKNGRVTKNGIHYVHGTPLEESEFKNDPMNPMTESNLVSILQQQTKRKVANLDYTYLEKGSDYLKEKILSMKNEFNYVILDVRSQDDLKTIAEAVYDFKIICGASAIAEEVAPYYTSDYSKGLNHSIPDRKKGVLVTAGSLMPQTKAQIEKSKSEGIIVEALDTLKLFNDMEKNEEINRLVNRACNLINSGKDIVIHTTNEISIIDETKKAGVSSGYTEAETSKLVSRNLAIIAQRIVENTNQHRILVAGGDTSGSFCEVMGVTGMQVFKEIQPGLPSCITLQKTPLFLILKSGSFGNPEFFIQSIEHLKSNL